MSNIVEVVVADKNLATMLKGVKATELEVKLSKTGPFTVFAPTDLAFSKLALGEMTDLLRSENKAKLTTMLKYHVIEGRTNFKELKDGQKFKSINGKDLNVKVINGKVTINGARVHGPGSEASNGVVHALDALISVT